MNEKLIVALDTPTIRQAENLVDQLDGIVSTYKVGLGLWTAHGFDNLVEKILKKNNKIFFDAKMYDIPNTIETAVRTAADRGISFVTVHYNRNIIEAAVKGRGVSDLRILTVMLLTSLDNENLKEMGYDYNTDEMIQQRAAHALDAGADGVIASPTDDIPGIKTMAHRRGKSFLVATPGIRFHSTTTQDHKRAGTPSQAISAGADYLIVGRPIYQAADPAKAAMDIIKEIN